MSEQVEEWTTVIPFVYHPSEQHSCLTSVRDSIPSNRRRNFCSPIQEQCAQSTERVPLAVLAALPPTNHPCSRSSSTFWLPVAPSRFLPAFGLPSTGAPADLANSLSSVLRSTSRIRHPPFSTLVILRSVLSTGLRCYFTGRSDP